MRQGSSPRQGDHLYKSIAGKSYCRNDAAFGSKADIQRPRKHVRFTPESGHVQCNSRCPLWANSGHRRHARPRTPPLSSAHLSLKGDISKEEGHASWCIKRKTRSRAFICWWQAKQLSINGPLVEGLPSWK